MKAHIVKYDAGDAESGCALKATPTWGDDNPHLTVRVHPSGVELNMKEVRQLRDYLTRFLQRNGIK